jgi:hypothetical protein
VISYRAAYAAAFALQVAGLLVAILTPWLWPGCAALGAGFLLQWRAGVARQEARWHQWNDDREDE